MKITILSTSIRKGRNSHRVALYLEEYINDHFDFNAEIYDLKKANFPLFEERLSHDDAPLDEAVRFGKMIQESDIVLVVCPEYNGGYPAAFKNAFDLLYAQWNDTLIGVFSVSSGNLGGSQVMQNLWQLFVKVKARPYSGVYIPNVTKHFSENGHTDTDWMVDQIRNYLNKLVEMAED